MKTALRSLVAALLVALTGGGASAQSAFRVSRGVQIIPGASRPSTETGRRTVWVDNSNNLRFYNGTSDLTLSSLNSYGTIKDEGSSLTQRSILNFIGSGVSCVDNAGATRTDCTISSGGSTGNWTFTGDAADDSGAAVLTIGATTATGVTIGRTAGANILAADTTLASGKTLTGAAASDLYLNAVTGQDVRLRVNGANVVSVGGTLVAINQSVSLAPNMGISISGAGTSAIDFSNGSGIFKTTTGAATFGGSSNTFTNGLTGPSGGLTIGDSGNISTRTAETNAATFTDFAIRGNSHTTNTDRILFNIDGTDNWSNLLGENTSVLFQLSHNIQFQTGAMATQREIYVSHPTYSFVGASVITDAATMAISGPPTAGSNATITNPYALWVESGVTYLAGGAKFAGSLTGTYNIAGTPTATSPILANLGATTVAPTWTAVSYQNGWVDNSGSSVSRYTKDALGIVTVEIRMKSGTNGTTAFTLPAGYRPGQTITVVGIVSAGTIAVGDISSAGVFTISISSTAGTFARVHFSAEG